MAVVLRARVLATASLALALFGVSCRHHAPQTGVSSERVDTLWYATSRQRANNRLAYKLADSVEYGFYRITSRSGVDPMRDALDVRLIDSVRVSAEEFLRSISAPSNTASDGVIVSVHGYAISHNKAIHNAAESFLRSGTTARWVAFSWPSNGYAMHLLQPSRWFGTAAYRTDSIAAVKSKPAFARLLLMLHTAIGGSRLILVTHSLGAQLAVETLTGDSLVRSRLIQDPLRVIGLFEPDLPSHRFAEYTVPRLQPITRRMVLYSSTNDWMLRFSSLVNRSGRAGLLRKSAGAIPGLETVDVTNGETSENWFGIRLGMHHAMRRETGALRDFVDIVVAGRPPSCRLTNGTARLLADSVWHLLPVRAAKSVC